MTDNQKSKNDRIKFLENEIERHRFLYYNEEPEISDAKYDALEEELKELDPNNPVLFKIGVDDSELFTKKEHIIPMMSQDKVTTPTAFRKWVKDKNFKVFIVQFKLDGISIELQYKKGSFQYAVTRGNGVIGDDVSANVIKMKGFVPKLKLPFTGAVRGEILMYFSTFNEKYPNMQNCRNTAAGIVRRKDGEGSNDLNLLFYDAISLDETVVFEKEIDKIKWLKSQGFNTVRTKTVKSTQEVIDVRKMVMETTRNDLDYDIDGLVIKGNVIDLEDMKRAKPRMQVAFKFPAEEIETTLLDIEWSRSGQNYTPVGIVERVKLMGTNVSRASLSNPDMISSMGIKLGAKVIVSKRGDIIPKIERVIEVPPYAKEVSLPAVCETCKTDLINEGTRLYCPNENCPKRAYHRILRWIWMLGVKYFSRKLMVKPLFNMEKIKSIVDLYKLKTKDLIELEEVKQKSAQKALDNLHAVKQVPLAKFVAGFNIENIGVELTQRAVEAGFDSLDKLYNASINDLTAIDGFAEITAQTLKGGIKKLYPQMRELLDSGAIEIKSEKQASKQLEGLSFCFTGKLNSMSRKEAEELVREHGGQAKSSVIKGLSYLVTNSTEKTTKFNKAQEQGTEIITEKEFLELI